MYLIGRLLKLLLVILVVVVVAAGAFVGWVGARGLPQRDGTASLPGLSADVTVKRDTNGIAQIYASTPADLFAAEGYVHAQERMWQMDVWRHISSGTLSELFGQSELQTDEFIRTLGWRQSAQRDYDAADASTKAILKAYASGVNAWLSQHKDLGLPFVISGFLGAGGGLSGYQPAPWTPVDTLAWVKVESWQLGGDYSSEVFDLLLAKKVDAKAVAELSPPYPPGRPVIAPTGAPGVGGAGASGSVAVPDQAGGPESAAAIDPRVLALAGDPTSLLGLEQASDRIGQLAGFGPADAVQRSDGIGSNDWVVSGAHTASGSALLANDPHLGYSMPSLWYMVGLHCMVVSSACPYDVAGVSFPGGPGVVLGHDAHIAWGFTNVNPDVQDLFMEKVDPADPTQYEYKGQMRPFTTRKEVIKVAGGDPVTITVRSTLHGPVVSDVTDDLKTSKDGGSGLAGDGSVVYALEWTSTAVVDTTVEAVLKLDAATDFTSFRAALKLYVGPVAERRLRRHGRPHRLPDARPHPDPGRRHGQRAGARLGWLARLDRLRPVRRPAARLRPAERRDRDRQQRRGRRVVPALPGRRVGPRLPRRPHHGPHRHRPQADHRRREQDPARRPDRHRHRCRAAPGVADPLDRRRPHGPDRHPGVGGSGDAVRLQPDGRVGGRHRLHRLQRLRLPPAARRLRSAPGRGHRQGRTSRACSWAPTARR